MEPRRAADHRAAVGASSEREAMTHDARIAYDATLPRISQAGRNPAVPWGGRALQDLSMCDSRSE